MRRPFPIPVGTLLAAVAPLAASVPAATAETSDVLLFPEAAVVRVAPGTTFEEAPAAASGTVVRLGRLADGVAEVAAVRTVSVGAAGRTVRIDAGVVRLGVDGRGLRVCVDEGTASIDAVEVVEGVCLLFGTGESGTPLDPAAADLRVPAAAPAVPPVALADDPEELADRLVGGGATGEGEGGGEGSEAGGAAACLDTGGTGSEATGPEGSEVPSTEIDRSHHRVDVRVTLEGY